MAKHNFLRLKGLKGKIILAPDLMGGCYSMPIAISLFRQEQQMDD